MENELEVVNIRLVKEPSLYSEQTLDSPQAVVELMAKELSQYDREVFCILNMKNNGQVINMNLVSVGTINASLVIPREVFKSSILANASAIIGLHNHPSGNVKPSKEDMIVTRKLQKCGQLLGIELLDHIIVGGTNGKMLSFREEKMLNVTGRMDWERMLKKPRISVCVPSGVTEVEKKAVEDATLQAGAREVAIIEEPIAAAIGAGIDISRPCGNMIVDIGGGTTDIAVISLGGTVVSTSIKIAGDDFDEALVRYMRKKHNLLIGERTAEDIKIKIGSAYPRPEVVTMNVRGRNLVTGLPKTVEVTSEETEEALREATSQIVEAVHSVLEKTPPELASDIADRGIVLTGGGSLLSGLEDLIESKTGINTMTAEDPMTAVAIGTGKFIEFLSGYREE